MARMGGGWPALMEPGLARTSPPVCAYRLPRYTFSDAFTDWHAAVPVDLPTSSVSLLSGCPHFLTNLEVDTVPDRMVLDAA